MQKMTGDLHVISTLLTYLALLAQTPSWTRRNQRRRMLTGAPMTIKTWRQRLTAVDMMGSPNRTLLARPACLGAMMKIVRLKAVAPSRQLLKASREVTPRYQNLAS